MRPLDRLPSIRAKLGSVTVIAVAVTILVVYLLLAFALRRSERQAELRALTMEARGFAAQAFDASGAPVPGPPGTSPLTLVLDMSGRRIGGDLAPPPTVGRALAGEIDAGRMGALEYLGVPVVRSGRVVGAVYLAAEPEPTGLTGAAASALRFVRKMWGQLLLAGAIAGATALLLARWLARGMTSPLREMAAAARRMAQGDYRHRVRVSSRDEVGQLAEAFSRMAREMEGVERLRRELVANVSHELKTPISALRAHLENLLDGVERSDRETLAVMLAQSERLSRLVDELLDLSRLESGEVPLSVEPVLLRPLVEQVVAEVAIARAGHPVEVANDVAPALAPVRADAERLHQVLFNLLDNAVRFTPSGGRVGVTASSDGSRVEVSVADTGPGIPDTELSRVFERFYRLDHARSRSEGGTGIGLTIARSLVEAHGGAIWAECGREGGSVFRFSLPLWEPKVGLEAAPLRSLEAGSRDVAGERTATP